MAEEVFEARLTTPRPRSSTSSLLEATYGINGLDTTSKESETPGQRVDKEKTIVRSEDSRNQPVTVNGGNIHSSALSHHSFDSDLRAIKTNLKSLSGTVDVLHKILSSEVKNNEKRKAIAENSSLAVKKELTTLIKDEINALRKAYKEDIVQVRLEYHGEVETLRKTCSSQKVLIDELQEEISRLCLRADLLDSSSPAFVTISKASSIAERTFTQSRTFYSHPCGHPMHLSLVRAPQGGLLVMLHIEDSDKHDSLVTWPLLGKVIVEAIGFSAMDDEDRVHKVVGFIETDEKSGKKGGGGYVGELPGNLARDKSTVLQCIGKQSSMWKKNERTVDPYYCIKDGALYLRVITRLHAM